MSTNQKEFYITAEGVKNLKEELEDLTSNQRHKIAARLKEAKEYGDLSENTAWDDAKDQQAFLEGRISEIENILKHASVIQTPKAGGAVSLGSTVHLELENGVQKFTIVGSTEANPDKGYISNVSPIGQALIGKKPGEVVEVQVPSGTMTYKIMKVE